MKAKHSRLNFSLVATIIATVTLLAQTVTAQQWSTNNLPAATWANQGAPFIGTGGVLTNTLPVGTVPTKFFRLLLLGN
jgi:hypothetical protein